MVRQVGWYDQLLENLSPAEDSQPQAAAKMRLLEEGRKGRKTALNQQQIPLWG